MKEEKNSFNILLSLDNMFKVYSDIQDIVKTHIDLEGYSFDKKALYNSLNILVDVGFVKKTKKGYKKRILLDRVGFSKTLTERILDNYKEIIVKIVIEDQYFDSERKVFCISKNAIPLKYSGLFMLLYELKELSQENNNWLLTGDNIIKLTRNRQHRKISISELDNKLIQEKKLGDEAEEFVLEYEQKKLIDKGIDREPIRVSLYDVAAGFDILSYGDNAQDEIFIEVKSCNNKYEFHFTNNEISTSKNYPKKYWLYLFNRIDKTVCEICNPYELFFEIDSDEWIKEPDGYLIRKI